MTCPECNREFTVNQKGVPKGVDIECPYCHEECYYELSETKQVECPECEENFTLDEDRTPVGSMIECPHCTQEVYTEVFGTPFPCPECCELFTAMLDGKA